MKKSDQYISKAEYIRISNKIRDDIYKSAYNFKTTIFLCGADIDRKDKARYKIAEFFKWQFWYDLIYPEDVFDELLYSSKTKDLLSLEGLLADSVDAVVLIPESPGSFAELGAFANDEKLRNKLICLVDKRFKKDKSFINQGPLKLVKKANPFGLVFMDFNNIENEVDKLIPVLRKMKRVSEKSKNKISLLQLENFLLPSIYLLEPVSNDALVNLVSIATEDEENSFQTTTTALTILIKKKKIQLTTDGYRLTKLGLENFFAFQKTKTRLKRQKEKIDIDDLRLEIFNLRNRKKKLKI